MNQWEISCSETKVALEQENSICLIDCRTEQERNFCRIDPSLFLPLHNYNEFLDDFEHIKQKAVVVYCHHGVRSLQMANILIHFGFENVKSMAGGIDKWSIDIDVSIPRY